MLELFFCLGQPKTGILALNDGELHFPAVVLSAWRQRQLAGRRVGMGSPPREGREDATKPALAVPCSKRPGNQAGHSPERAVEDAWSWLEAEEEFPGIHSDRSD